MALPPLKTAGIIIKRKDWPQDGRRSAPSFLLVFQRLRAATGRPEAHQGFLIWLDSLLRVFSAEPGRRPEDYVKSRILARRLRRRKRPPAPGLEGRAQNQDLVERSSRRTAVKISDSGGLQASCFQRCSPPHNLEQCGRENNRETRKRRDGLGLKDEPQVLQQQPCNAFEEATRLFAGL